MNYEQIVNQIGQIHLASQATVARSVNYLLTVRNWLIGAYIVEYEQDGEDRAKYGARLFETLARDLSHIRGLGVSALKNYRQFALAYPLPAIRQPLVGELQPFTQMLSSRAGELAKTEALFAFPSLIAHHAERSVLEWQNADYYAELFHHLSWTHLLELSRLDNPLKRAFYEIECQKSRWSRRELKRQINSMLYERIGLSKDKDAVLQLANEGQLIESPATIIRDPYVLEFLGLEEKAEFSEQQLEQALLDHLQKFLLELGRDFCFVGRQVRITVAGRHHYLDLLFFHRRLRCLIAYELKLGEFQHEYAGQMNFYLNYLREEETLKGENPPVGVILCADKDVAEVHYATAGMDQQLFISRYLVALPSAERLKLWLLEEQELLQRRKDND